MPFLFPTPFGHIGLHTANQTLLKITFLPDKDASQEQPNGFIRMVCKKLDTYFKNPHIEFDDISMDLQGTLLQKKIWQLLRTIPVGDTVTYKFIADKLKTSPRVVGNACRANPIPLFIPCHRVVAQQGLGGFAGDKSGKLLDIKKWLLQHEKRPPHNHK